MPLTPRVTNRMLALRKSRKKSLVVAPEGCLFGALLNGLHGKKGDRKSGKKANIVVSCVLWSPALCRIVP